MKELWSEMFLKKLDSLHWLSNFESKERKNFFNSELEFVKE